MSKYYYHKGRTISLRGMFRIASLLLTVSGIAAMVYVFFPLLSWQLYFQPVFASDAVAAPIPRTVVVSPSTIQSLLAQASNTLIGVDYSNAANWFPNFDSHNNRIRPRTSYYKLSIPKLAIKDAVVSAADNDLNQHLVNYEGTAIPPEKGTAVIFGHSTLPQLFDPKNYKAIFATAHTLRVGDDIETKIYDTTYTYKIFNITVVDPEDTSLFTQDYDNAYLTLVTCTPPGTTWKRLVIRARIEKT